MLVMYISLNHKDVYSLRHSIMASENLVNLSISIGGIGSALIPLHVPLSIGFDALLLLQTSRLGNRSLSQSVPCTLQYIPKLVPKCLN